MAKGPGADPPRRGRLLALLVVLTVLVTGCNLQLEVVVDLEEDGSGTVTAGVGLDAEAQARFPPVGDLLVASDLTAAGWEVGPAQPRPDGRQWVQAVKAFDNPAELQAILDELFGPQAGVFTGWQIERSGDRATETYEVTGVVDLTGGIELFSDAQLAGLVEEPPIGTSTAQIEAELGVPIEDTVSARVVVQLPSDGDDQVFDVRLGERREIAASATSENRVAQLLGWVRTALLILFGLAVVLAIVNLLLDRRYARRRPAARPARVSERVPGGSDAAAGPGAGYSAPRSRMQMIVLDAHDVLFHMSPDPFERLIPFIRERGGQASDDEILELHRQATLGRMHAAAFWQAVGVAGDPVEIDAELLSRVRLQQGAKEFLREMHRRGVPVAVVTNDLAEWSYRLRDLHGMSGVAPWIVSSEVGVRKPDPAAFEALRRLTGVPYHAMLWVDGQIPSLDMARTLGMMTAWFAREKPAEDAQPGHTVVTKFSDFFRRRRPEEPSRSRRRSRA